MAFSFKILAEDFASSKIQQICNNINKLERLQGFRKLKDGGDKLGQSINDLRLKLDVLNQQRTASNSISQMRQLKTEIKQTERALNRLENMPPLGFVGRLRGIGSQLGGLVGISGGFGLALGGAMAAGKVIKMGMEMEQTNTKFEVLLGSANKAKEMLGGLNKFADATPFSNESIIQGSEVMLGYGMSAEKILPNIKMLGDVAMGNDEKLRGLAIAFSQIGAAGRLQGQDLLQLISNGFNPLTIIAKKTGTSMADLKKKMEDG